NCKCARQSGLVRRDGSACPSRNHERDQPRGGSLRRRCVRDRNTLEGDPRDVRKGGLRGDGGHRRRSLPQLQGRGREQRHALRQHVHLRGLGAAEDPRRDDLRRTCPQEAELPRPPPRPVCCRDGSEDPGEGSGGSGEGGGAELSRWGSLTPVAGISGRMEVGRGVRAVGDNRPRRRVGPPSPETSERDSPSAPPVDLRYQCLGAPSPASLVEVTTPTGAGGSSLCSGDGALSKMTRSAPSWTSTSFTLESG